MSRLERALGVLEKAGASCAILQDESSIRYLCGFSGDSSLLYLDRERLVLLTDGRYTEQAKEEMKEGQVELHQGRIFLAAAALAGQQARVAFDGAAFSYCDYLELREALGPKAELLSVDLAGIRQVKEEAELALLQQAAEIEDAALEKLLGELRPGLRESQVAAKLEYYLASLGSEKPAFDTIVASGPRSALPHGRATDRVLEAGDLVTLDFGAVCGGYHGDVTRTLVLGRASPWQRSIYNLVLSAQLRGLAAAQAGCSGRQLDFQVRGVLAAVGYGAHYCHGTGHGVGLEIHELPAINGRGREPLAEGMTFTIEPGLYFPGQGGVRIEDSVVLTAAGARPLNKFTKELLELS